MTAAQWVRDNAATQGGADIVAVPAALADRIHFEPALPGIRDQLTQRLPAGWTIELHAAYEHPFWRDDGLSGIIQSTDAFCRIILDATPPDDTSGILVGFLEGATAVRAAHHDRTERRKQILDNLTQAFGPRAAEPTDYIERDCTAEPWTRRPTPRGTRGTACREPKT